MSKITKLIFAAVILASNFTVWCMNYGNASQMTEGGIITDTICKNPNENYHYDLYGLDTILGENDPEAFTLILETPSGDMLHLFVTPTYHLYFPDFPGDVISWCNNYPYTEYGLNIPTSDLVPGTHVYDLNLETVDGCDSIVSVEVTTYPAIEVVFEDTICNQNYYDNDTLGGLHYTNLYLGKNEFIYTYEQASSYGCDSTVIIRIHVGLSNEKTIFDFECEGEGYHRNGLDIDYLSVGDTTLTSYLENKDGCDSILTIQLTVREKKWKQLPLITICQGEDYHDSQFHIINPAAGMCHDTMIYTSELTGCDSLVILNLNVLPASDTTIHATICNNDWYFFGSQWIYGGNLEPNSTHHYERHEENHYGCDSLINLELYVMPTSGTTFFETICFGYTYTGHGFINQYVSPGNTNYIYKYYENSFGCDSIVEGYITVLPQITDTIIDTICDQDYYNEYGFSLDSLEPGIYERSMIIPSSILDCDSTVYLKLYVGNSQDINYIECDTICYGSRLFIYNFKINMPPVYPGEKVYKTVEGDNYLYDTITSALGCDSIVCLHLYSRPNHSIVLNPHHCNEPGLPNPPEYPIQLTAADGCDSIIVFSHEYPWEESYFFFITDTVCLGNHYQENGLDTIFPEAGRMQFNYFSDTTIYGCDSIADCDIFVMPLYDTILRDTTCQNHPYNKFNFNPGDDIYYPGTYTYIDSSHYSIFGCDSVVTLELYVAPEYHYYPTYEFCDSAVFNDFGFDTTIYTLGNHTLVKNLKTVFECDSIITVEIDIVGNSKYTYLSDSGCLGERYIKHNFDTIPTELGLLYDTLYITTNAGCDSTVYLELTVNPIYDTTFYDTICQGENYTGHGFNNINTSTWWLGQHSPISKTYPSINNCDSIIYLRLYVAPTYDMPPYIDTIDLGEDYHFREFDTINPPAGIHHLQHTLESIHECDSIINLILHVARTYDTLFTDTTCLGNIYYEHGFEHSALDTGWYSDTLSLLSVYGRDSIVRLNLWVAPVFDTVFYDTICQGCQYIGHGFDTIIYDTGWHLDTINPKTIFGCDSTVRLELYVAPIYDTTFFDTICFGEEYHEHGFNLDSLNNLGIETNYDTLFFTTILGYDSIVKLELYVAPLYDITLVDTACYGEHYNENGFNLPDLIVGMNYATLHLQSIFGCDSIVNLELLTGALYDTTFIDSICFGEEYHKHGFDLYNPVEDWNYDTMTWASVLKCDSVVYLELFVHEFYQVNMSDIICEGEDYHLNNFDTINPAPGLCILQKDTVSMYGCDGIATMELFVSEIKDVHFYDSTCAGNDYNDHGFILNNLEEHEGLLMQHQDLSMHGCDSTTTLHLVVHPRYPDIDIFDTICFGEDYHNYNFDTINPPIGTCVMHTDTVSMYGCDSIVTLHLLVNEVFETDTSATICYGETFTINGVVLDSLNVGINIDTLIFETTMGCDSAVIVELLVNPVYGTTFLDTICLGEEYHEHGFNINDPNSLEPGNNYDTLFLATTLNCDSTVYLDLYVADVYDIHLFDTICFGEDYHNHNFDTINPPTGVLQMYKDTVSMYGCDSIVTLHLLVGDVVETRFTDSICINESYHEHGFELDSVGEDWFYDTLFLSSIAGCDSTVTLELFVMPIYDTLFRDTICYGNGYHEHGFDFNNSNDFEIGTNRDTLFLQTTSGCDSVVRLELFVASFYDNIEINDSICFGESYHEYGFELDSLNNGMNHDTLNLTTMYGCDSIVMLNLFVKDTVDIRFKADICIGESYDDHGFTFESPEVGTHTDFNTFISANGCDSIVTLTLDVHPDYSIDVYDSVCEDESYTLHGLNFQPHKPGVYQLKSELSSMYGCDSILNISLKVIPILHMPDEIHGDSIVYVTTNTITGRHHYYIDSIPYCTEYFWTFDNDETWVIEADGNHCDVIVLRPDTKTLTVTARNSCGEESLTKRVTATFFGYGVDENGAVKANVYPNPSSGFVNVECDGIEVINILSMTGVVVKAFKFDKENLVSLDLCDLPNTIYVFEIVTARGKCLKRVTKTGY